jgi:hypothetical protein
LRERIVVVRKNEVDRADHRSGCRGRKATASTA